MILAAFASILAWATASPPVAGGDSPAHPGRGAPEARVGWGAAQPRESSDKEPESEQRERSDQGATTTHVFRHEGWRREGTSPANLVDTEDVLPMASLRGGELVVRLLEPDGHALATRGPVTQTQEVLGAFGLRLWKYQSSPGNWVVDGYHGEEVNRGADVAHFGARHLVLRDGLWMQPEPLLYLGLTNGDLSSPVGYSGVYAAGDSNRLQDRSGHMPVLVAAAAPAIPAVVLVAAGAAAGVGCFGVLESTGVVATVGDAGSQLLSQTLEAGSALVGALSGGSTAVDPDEKRAAIQISLSEDAGSRTSAPFLPSDPYSPESVDARRSERRRELGTGNEDPDSDIPDQGPGKNVKDGVHTSEGKAAHRPGQRNVAGKGMEEHNRVAPGTGGRGAGN